MLSSFSSTAVSCAITSHPSGHDCCCHWHWHQHLCWSWHCGHKLTCKLSAWISRDHTKERFTKLDLQKGSNFGTPPQIFAQILLVKLLVGKKFCSNIFAGKIFCPHLFTAFFHFGGGVKIIWGKKHEIFFWEKLTKMYRLIAMISLQFNWI